MSVSQLQQLELKWENQIQKGNLLFQTSAFTEAYAHYMEAMIVSELLIDNITTSWQHSSRVPGMYYTACINVAQNYWGMQDLKNAADYYLYCTYKMKKISEKEDVGDLLKQSASIYWLKAIKAYTEFSKKTGVSMPADIDKSDTYLQLERLKVLFSIRQENMN